MPIPFSEKGQHYLRPRHDTSVLCTNTRLVSSSGIINQHPCYFRVMDPFSLAVGISGLVTLTAQTLKLSQQYFHGVKHASEAANSLATELQLLHNALCRLVEFLHSDSAKRQSFDETSVLVSSTSACKTKLEVIHKKLEVATKDRLHRALWPLNEKEHRQSVQELRAVSQCIQFAMAIDEW